MNALTTKLHLAPNDTEIYVCNTSEDQPEIIGQGVLNDRLKYSEFRE